jgi:hypothetical protein
MGLDTTKLDNSIAQLAQQADKTVGNEASAGVVISGIKDLVKKAVADALDADKAANQASIDAASSAIDGVFARLSAADDQLGAAIASNAS